jgi:tetratricopeptide (TPR) repeat protein
MAAQGNPELLAACASAFVAYNDGCRLRRLGENELAIEAFTRSIALDPSLVSAYYNRGNAFEALRQYGSAVADFHKATALDPSHYRAWCNMGRILLLTGHVNEAMTCLDKASELGDEKARLMADGVRRSLKGGTQ